LTSKYAKSAYIISFSFFKNAIWVSKNTELIADFESVEKVAQELMQKKLSTKK
jgi:hypothetical protein